MSRLVSYVFGLGYMVILYGCASQSVYPTSVVVDDVFTCSGSIVQKSEIRTKYTDLTEEGKSGTEVILALDQYIKGAGMSDENYLQYSKCIISLNRWRQKHKSVLFAALSKVELNAKSRLVSSKALRSDEGEGFSKNEINKLVEWLVNLVPVLPEPTLKINIPKEIENGDNVEDFFKGMGSLKPSYYLGFDTELGFKGNILLNGFGRDGHVDTTLLPYPFYINVVIPGYEPVMVKVEKGKEINEVKQLKKIPVKIAIEKFSGKEHGVAERLGADLSLRSSDFTVYDPEYLKRFRERIETEQGLQRNSVVQTDTLGLIALDYIISGSVTSQLDK